MRDIGQRNDKRRVVGGRLHQPFEYSFGLWDVFQNIAAHHNLIMIGLQIGVFHKRIENLSVKRPRQTCPFLIDFHRVHSQTAVLQRLTEHSLRGSDIENRAFFESSHMTQDLLVTTFRVVVRSVMNHVKFCASDA